MRSNSLENDRVSAARRMVMVSLVACASALAGCAGRPALIPNSDPALRMTSAQFAADAAKRTYHAEAERADTTARAEIEYGIKQVRLVNLTDKAWENVEVWVNQKYVCHVPKMPPHKLETINFQMLYDTGGNYMPIAFAAARVKKVEVYKDGKLYNVPVALAD